MTAFATMNLCDVYENSLAADTLRMLAQVFRAFG